ncbi:MAG TPA: polymer-forming cytoskeletal protein [Burkholderiales bacterium]|nr:polymer-forming cytoskeletal protein [Burkholderiales bacterium]
MFEKKRSKPRNRIESLIGTDTKVIGDITFSGGIRIDGTVIGNVAVAGDEPAMLVLSSRARIEGDVAVSHLVIDGTVAGSIRATEVELQRHARITGDVHYKALEIRLGAVVQGRLMHEVQPSAERVIPLKSAGSDIAPAIDPSMAAADNISKS